MVVRTLKNRKSLKIHFACIISFIVLLSGFESSAQSLRGKVIYISPSQEVRIKFRSGIVNYSFVNKDQSNAFKVKPVSNKQLLINSEIGDFKSANLVITEGENTHLLILAYKDKLDAATETVYDFSTREKLQQETAKMAAPIKATPPKFTKYTSPQESDTLVSKPVANTEIQADKSVETRSDPKEDEAKYANLVALADKAYLNGNLDEANGLYTAALIIKPNDNWSTTRLSSIKILRESAKEKEMKSSPAITKNETVKTTTNNKQEVKLPQSTTTVKEEVKPPPTVTTKKEVEKPQVGFTVNNSNTVNTPPKPKPASPNEIQYKKEIDKADRAFNERNYARARTFYLAAQKLNSSETYPGERITAIDEIIAQAKEDARAEADRKAAEAEKKAFAKNLEQEYEFAIRHGNAAMNTRQYKTAQAYYAKAKELKPAETYAEAQLALIDVRLVQMKDSLQYDNYIHTADSLAWTAKEYRSALKWYDSAQRIKPHSTYPAKQIRAAKFIQTEIDSIEAVRARSAALNNAMSYYRKAETLMRVDKNYEEAYKVFAEFLQQMDNPKILPYKNNDLHYINEAKDYMSRLDFHISKPKPQLDTVITPVVEEEKTKRKKKRNQ